MASAKGELSARLSGSSAASEKEATATAADENGSGGRQTMVKIELRSLGAAMWYLNWLRVLAHAADMSRLQLLAAGLTSIILKRCNTQAEAAQAESTVQQLRQQALALVQIKLSCSMLVGGFVGNICYIAGAPQVVVVTTGVLGMLFNLIGVPTGVWAVIFRPHWCLTMVWITVMKAANGSDSVVGEGDSTSTLGDPWPLADWQIPVLISTLILVQAYVSNVLEPTLYRGYFMQLSDGDANEGSYDAALVPRTSVTTMVRSVETVDALQNEVRYQMGWRGPSISVQNDVALANAEAGETASTGIDDQTVHRILLVGEGKRAGKVLEQGTLVRSGISLESTPVIIVCELAPPPSRVSSSEGQE